VLHRQEGETPDQVAFKRVLKHASHGGLSLEDWEFLNRRAEANLSAVERGSFSDAVCLYTTREEVEAVNFSQLEALHQPCARIKAQHDGRAGGHKAKADEAGGLENHVFLSRGAKVMVNRNLWADKGLVNLNLPKYNLMSVTGLVNATIGMVEDVVWLPRSTRSDLPLAVLISCPTYTRPTLWKTAPRPGFPDGIPIIPIPPVKFTFEYGGAHTSRTQIPLRLAWAVTVHKSQGLTLRKVKLGLGKKEFATGLTFVALSRVKTVDSLMITGAFDYARVKCPAGSNYERRLEDFARRYHR
jgi:hypothetical protein